MNARRLKTLATIAVLLITVAVFVRYFIVHPTVRSQLHHTPMVVLIELFALYLLGIVALAGVTLATLRLCNARLPTSDSLLLTAYSSVINFFGPLQSGPAFRAIYLKTKLGLKLKDYATATLVYYFFYGGFSGLMLISGWLHWWIAGVAILGLATAFLIVQFTPFKNRIRSVDLHGWYYLASATAAQVIVVLFIYFIELSNVAPGTHFWQAVVYTGAANLSLFVSITPGAIGFRESFLVFSQHLHHISNTSIVAASILDRSMYIVLLLVLAVYIFGSHARQRLERKN